MQPLLGLPEQLMRELPQLLREHRPDLMVGERLYRSPALAQAFLQSEQPTLTLALPRDIACFRLLLPKGTLFSEEGPEIRSVVVAEVRAMEGWLLDNFELAGGGLACVGLGEDGSTYLASSLLDPSAKAQQPEHTSFSPAVWEWDADGVRGTAARMEQLCVHALLVQLYAEHLVSEGEIPPPPGAKGFGGGVKKASPSADDVKPPVWLGRGRPLRRAASPAFPPLGGKEFDGLGAAELPPSLALKRRSSDSGTGHWLAEGHQSAQSWLPLLSVLRLSASPLLLPSPELSPSRPGPIVAPRARQDSMGSTSGATPKALRSASS